MGRDGVAVRPFQLAVARPPPLPTEGEGRGLGLTLLSFRLAPRGGQAVGDPGEGEARQGEGGYQDEAEGKQAGAAAGQDRGDGEHPEDRQEEEARVPQGRLARVGPKAAAARVEATEAGWKAGLSQSLRGKADQPAQVHRRVPINRGRSAHGERPARNRGGNAEELADGLSRPPPCGADAAWVGLQGPDTARQGQGTPGGQPVKARSRPHEPAAWLCTSPQ
jgi:hypothetical protein